MAETEKERVDRELIELLNELRVALPGVQVLFAFLLLLPFQQAFAQVTPLERGLYYVAFAANAAASVLLIAPSTYHRIRFRDGDKSGCCGLPTSCSWPGPPSSGWPSRPSHF